MQGREKKSGKIHANVFVWREDILDWLNAMAMLGHNLFLAHLSITKLVANKFACLNWRSCLFIDCMFALINECSAFRWVYICHFVFWLHLCRWFHFWWMLCLFRSAFLSAVCFGRTDNGSWECRGVRFWNRFRLLHVNAWFWMLPWVLPLRDVFRFGNGNWAQQVCLRKQCYFGKLSREVRARTTRERREGLYESSRAVSMVDGSPRAPSLTSIGSSKS